MEVIWGRHQTGQCVAGSQEDTTSGEAAQRSTTALHSDPAPTSLSSSKRPRMRVPATGALQTVLTPEKKVAGRLRMAQKDWIT